MTDAVLTGGAGLATLIVCFALFAIYARGALDSPVSFAGWLRGVGSASQKPLRSYA